MKIALVGPTHPFRGGISHYNTILMRSLIERGHQATLISLIKQYPRLLFPGKTQQDESELPFIVPNDPSVAPLSPTTWFKTARKIEKLGPDLALFQWWHPFFGPAFGTIARRLKRFGVRTGLLCHNVRPHESTPIDRLLSRYAFAPTDTFILHAENDRAILESICPNRDVFVTPHPTYDAFKTDASLTRSASKARLDLAERPTLLYFGNVRKYKGITYLVDAMAKIVKCLDCQLLLVGEFYYDKTPIVEKIACLGLNERIRLVDRYVANEEVALFFTAADVVILPYISATQSGIAQIAFAFERAVIGTDVGGIPEAVTHEKTGLIIPPRDSEALASAVIRFFSEDLEERLAQNIRGEAARFSWNRLVETLEKAAQPGPHSSS